MSSRESEPPSELTESPSREPLTPQVHDGLAEDKPLLRDPQAANVSSEREIIETACTGCGSSPAEKDTLSSSFTTGVLSQRVLSPSVRNLSTGTLSYPKTGRATGQGGLGRLTTQDGGRITLNALNEEPDPPSVSERAKRDQSGCITTSQNATLTQSQNSKCSRISDLTTAKLVHGTPDNSASVGEYMFQSASSADSPALFDSAVPTSSSPSAKLEDFNEVSWQVRTRSRVSLLAAWFLFIMVLGSCIGLVSVVFHLVVHKLSHSFQPEVCPNSTPESEDSDFCANRQGGISTLTYIAVKSIVVIVIAEATCYFSTIHMPEIHGGGILPVKVCLAVGASVPFRVGIMRFLISSVYLGSGNPLGAETPTLHYACAVACSLYSLANRLCGKKYFPEDNKTSMVMMGCVCGMAAAFNSVLAGMVYHVEHFSHGSGFMIQRLMGFYTVMACLMSCIVGRLIPLTVALGIDATIKDDRSITEMGITHTTDSLLLVVLALFSGVFFGGVSHSFLLFTAGLRARLSCGVPEEHHGLISGVVTAIVAGLCFYFTRLDGVWGVGWESLSQILTHEHEPWHRVIFLCAKFFACCFAVACGGNGGIFGPALVIGGAAGSVLSDLLFFLGDDSLPYRVMPVLGMSGVFAGIHRLPLTAIIVCYEFVDLGATKDNLIFLMLGVSFMSELVASELCELDIFGVMMLQDGVNPQSFAGCRFARLSHDPEERKAESSRHVDLTDAFDPNNEVKKSQQVFRKRFSATSLSNRRLSNSSALSRNSNVTRQVDLLRCVAIRAERAEGAIVLPSPSLPPSSLRTGGETCKPNLRHASSSEKLESATGFFGHAAARKRRSSTVYSHVDDCLVRLGLIIPPNIEERSEAETPKQPWAIKTINKEDGRLEKKIWNESNIDKTLHEKDEDGDGDDVVAVGSAPTDPIRLPARVSNTATR